MSQPRPSRKEARAERRNLKKADEEVKRVRLLQHPDIVFALAPRVAVDPKDIYNQRLTWCVTQSDVDGKWSWHEPRQWTDEEYSQHIEKTLNNLTGNTWKQIEQMFRDGQQMHHSQNLFTLHEEAQERWITLGLETDEAYRFSLTGRQRAWGYRLGSHFLMVWYDRYHTLYKVEKSGT